MKRIYLRFRPALMAFTLGLASVYLADGLAVVWNEVPVELPTAKSSDVFVVFPDKRQLLTRERNCGKDPANPQDRLACENEKIFEGRSMELYLNYEIDCEPPANDYPVYDCGQEREFRRLRNQVWRSWSEKKRTHILIKYSGDGWRIEHHYFLEPDQNNNWHLVIKGVSFVNLRVEDESTNVRVVDFHRIYAERRWKVATEDDPGYVRPGTRFLEFSAESGFTDQL